MVKFAFWTDIVVTVLDQMTPHRQYRGSPPPSLIRMYVGRNHISCILTHRIFTWVECGLRLFKTDEDASKYISLVQVMWRPATDRRLGYFLFYNGTMIGATRQRERSANILFANSIRILKVGN